MGLRTWTLCALLSVFLVILLPSQTESVAVMSVDMGSEWMKIAIVKPGVPMEIVLNKESRRKTPCAVALKDNERLFGDNAVGMAAKNPKVTMRYFQDLLGKRAENPQVESFRNRFPEYNVVKDEERGTVLLKLSEELTYTPEELLAMMLNYSRILAEEFAEQTIKDIVITVPAFFNQAERRSVLQAAKLAGLKVLQLINDNTAVALNYGVFRRNDINSTAQNIMFYDMGSRSTTCTIVTYQTTKTKESGIQPQLQIRGVGFDRSLGGLEVDLRLRDRLAKLFNEQKKSRKDVRENPRAMAKLLKEANRVKTILSANNDHMAQIEGLMDDIDFKSKVTRQDLEELCGDLFERVSSPVQKALSSAEMKMDEIDQVIIVGGSTRIPKVQELLLKAVGKEELGKNINADEAASMGAVYQAAALSKAFKVKPFVVRDAAVFPIQVEFTREVEEENVKSLKHNKRILFQRLAPYPQRKVITFNRYNDDFEFNINYGDLSFLDAEDLKIFGSLNLTTVKLRGVGESFQKNVDYESKGIKAHFNMDESGILSLDRVEAVFETVVEEKPEQESTLTKLGNTISSLFGGGSSTAESKENATDSVQEEEEVPTEATKEDDQESTTPASEQANSDTKAEDKKTEEKKEGEKVENKDSKEKEETTKEAESTKSPEEEPQKPPPPPPKKQKLVDEIGAEQTVNDIQDLAEEEVKRSVKKLQELTERDLEKHEREKAANSLEAFIFETQDKLEQNEFRKVSTKDQREEILLKLSQASTWLEDEGYTAATKELKDKLSELKKVCKSLFFKVEERRKWPEKLSALDSLLNHSSIFLKSARMIPDDDPIFTEIELNTLEKLINDTWVWKNETLAEQAKLPATEKPILLSKDIEQKLAALDREIQYLLNKAKFSKPKPKPKPKSNTTKSDNGEKNTTESAEKKKESTEAEPPSEPEPAKEPPTEEKVLELEGSEADSSTQKPSEEKQKTEL